MKLERVAIGIDFSAPSLEAARWTARHFARGAELVLVHAVHIPEPPRFLRGRYPEMDDLVESARKGAEERLQAAAASLTTATGATRVRTQVRIGEPSAVLAAVVADVAADVVVVGPHGERERPWNLLGSTAQHLVKLSPVPVLLATGVHRAAPRSLLVPIADFDVTPEVLRWARLLVERFDARVTALHVVSSAAAAHVLAAAPLAPTLVQGRGEPWLEEIRGEADRWMAGLLAAGLPSGRVASEVTFGEAGQEILAAADRMECEMIVMGRRHEGGMRRALLGSITSEVLRGATCPVLVVGEPDLTPER